ncbi:sugar lactone lactonase YvrE [Microbacterium endophyticum]|uniref:Sugar lactone lactonase YvrE n=1 Tax=Microbacterium endophyticum TaxID=1526412 RepID=A0A7W4V3L7_9MICO|nr:SMP-30/gluconolactonase/LRE family protein [Microbacterium endophyticum]MBB2975904.1 sugar lactone lactonase YvrE [Microbacterium endophyticum]NIK36387.1 sugar lactone lactonase YvrE [Microbacterium endophyticum]
MVTETVFRRGPAILVESLWWDARTEEMVWVDISAGTMHRGRLDGNVDGSDDRVVELPPPVSAVQPAVGSGYVAALKDRVVALDSDGLIERTIAHVTHSHDGIRCNEGKVDPFGRFLVGSMDITTGEPDGTLVAVEADGSVRTLRGGFAVANGFEWSDSGDIMFVTDTATKTVYRASYSSDGKLGELEPYLVGRMSDGLVRRREGGFINGLYGESAAVLWGDADGTPAVSQEFAVSAPNVTSVAFGGPDLGSLFVGTARENLTEADLESHPLSGAIFRIDGVGHGYAVHTFGASASHLKNTMGRN